MFSRIVAYLLGDRDGLTDAGRAAQGRFRANIRMNDQTAILCIFFESRPCKGRLFAVK